MASSQSEPDSLPEYNILLLGESGAGKSMFINSFIQYTKYQTLAQAQNDPIPVVIPVKFKVVDDKRQPFVICEGADDGNERLENTALSSTSSCRSYAVIFDKFRVRLIDTPGVGSPVIQTDSNKGKMDKHQESVEQDKKYIEDIFDFTSQFRHLHAIAIVVKSMDTRYTTRFELCLKQLLTNFSKSAMDNVFIILTFGEAARYTSDIVAEPLKMLLGNITNSTSDDLTSVNRVYSVDNKALRYLLAIKQGASFNKHERNNCETAWTKSRDECQRFIDCLRGLDDQPELILHKINYTRYIKKANMFINQLEPLLVDILKVYNNNEENFKSNLIKSLECFDKIVAVAEDYNNKKTTEVLRKPRTVCLSQKCFVDNNDDNASNVCCQGCRVSMKRLFCPAFEFVSGDCKVCGCHISHHANVPFSIKVVYKSETKIAASLKKIKSARKEKERIDDLIRDIVSRQQTIRDEMTAIETVKRALVDFLKTNELITTDTNDGDNEVTIEPDQVFANINELQNLEMFGVKIGEICKIVESGNEDKAFRWARMDSYAETTIVVTNAFSNSHEDNDN